MVFKRKFDKNNSKGFGNREIENGGGLEKLFFISTMIDINIVDLVVLCIIVHNLKNMHILVEETGSDLRLQQSLENDAIDAKYGFNRYKE
ncbi:hypothetical protein Avbf_10170 [Armadillidium vulgare]|nr:hypothetical protein Avbf_10170 [Armadillidium vulgare]